MARRAQGRNGRVSLRLFVGGQTANSLAACVAVEACLGLPELGDGADLIVVDVEAQPEAARQHGILATPTLVIEHSGRSFRLVGDLSRGEQLHDLLRVAATANR